MTPPLTSRGKSDTALICPRRDSFPVWTGQSLVAAALPQHDERHHIPSRQSQYVVKQPRQSHISILCATVYMICTMRHSRTMVYERKQNRPAAAAGSHCWAMLQERERDSMEELEAAKQQAQAATHAFSAVRQARYDTFMQAFNHISAGIDKIFKVSQMASICNTA